MSATLSDPKRNPVPRWRPWRVSAGLGLLDSTGSKPSHLPGPRDFESARLAWQSHRTLAHAADFLGTAFAMGRATDALPAAEFIVSAGGRARVAARLLAERILKGEQEQSGDSDLAGTTRDDRIHRISNMRRYLRNCPRDALTWLDLAREYVSIGQPRIAVRPIEIAVGLEGESRLVARSASRFFLHVGEPDRALSVLRRLAASGDDPWILAAEIAVSEAAGQPSRHLNRGLRIVRDGNHSPRHVSELASALATVELKGGRQATIRRLLKTALQAPTENAVAQAEWIRRRPRFSGIAGDLAQVPRTFEAQAWRGCSDEDWEHAVSAAWLWRQDEPFSSRSAAFGSGLALVALGDAEAGERFAQAGLITDPDDFALLNNLAVSLAHRGRPAEARTTFERIDREEVGDNRLATYIATAGLILYRSDQPSPGRSQYRAAIEAAEQHGNKEAMVWAILHFAQEESRYDPEAARQLLREGKDELDRLPPHQSGLATRIYERVSRATKEVPGELQRHRRLKTRAAIDQRCRR